MKLPTLSARADKLTPCLGVSLMIAGAFFLFDPYLSVFDLLPDCIGYLLLAMGLYRMADLDDRLAEAARGLRRLALLSLARPVALLLAFGFVSPQEQPMFILLALFSLGVLDLLLLIPMWKQLSAGLIYIGTRNNATALLSSSLGTRSLIEVYAGISVGYFILREVLVVLPEITVLTHEKGGVEMGQGTVLYDYVNLFRGAGWLVSLFLGLIWLIATVVFVRRLCADKPFFESLTAKYRAEVLPRHDLFARRAVRNSLFCLVAASVLSLDFYLDGVNILPDLLPAILLVLSVLFLRRYAGHNLPAIISAASYAVVSTIIWVLQLTYFGLEQSENILKTPDIAPRWYLTLGLQLAAGVLLLVTLYFVLRALYALCQRYTGLHALRADSSYAAERTDAIHKILRTRLTVLFVLATLTVLSTLFHWGGIPLLLDWRSTVYELEAVLPPYQATALSVVYRIFTEGYWFVDLALGGVLTVALISTTSEISGQMEYSSMMNE